MPNEAAMTRLRATLVEGKATPEIQRLLIESQSQSKCVRQSRCNISSAYACATSQQPKKCDAAQASNSPDASAEKVSVDAAERLAGTEHTLRNQNSQLYRQATALIPAFECDNVGTSPKSGGFFDWLRSIVLQHLHNAGCLLIEKADGEECAD